MFRFDDFCSYRSYLLKRKNICGKLYHSAERLLFYSVENFYREICFFRIETYIFLQKARKKVLRWKMGENTLLEKVFLKSMLFPKLSLQFGKDAYRAQSKIKPLFVSKSCCFTFWTMLETRKCSWHKFFCASLSWMTELSNGKRTKYCGWPCQKLWF